MAWWRAVAGELSALGTLAASMPLGLLFRDGFDPRAPHPTPVVLVHGLGGARRTSSSCEASSRAWRPKLREFLLPPRIDYQRLVPQVGRHIEEVCRDMGAPGWTSSATASAGLVARHLVELGNGAVSAGSSPSAPRTTRSEDQHGARDLRHG